MFVKGLWELITQDAGVSALVGNRVYFILQPKGTAVPSVVLSCVATKPLYALSGTTELIEALWQIDSYASDYYSATALQLALRDLLENYKGNLPDVEETAVISSIVEKAWDMPFEPGAKGFIYRSLLEVRFNYYKAAMPLPVSTPAGGLGVIDGGTGTNDDSI